jgi:hypothetical protein
MCRRSGVRWRFFTVSEYTRRKMCVTRFSTLLPTITPSGALHPPGLGPVLRPQSVKFQGCKLFGEGNRTLGPVIGVLGQAGHHDPLQPPVTSGWCCDTGRGDSRAWLPSWPWPYPARIRDAQRGASTLRIPGHRRPPGRLLDSPRSRPQAGGTPGCPRHAGASLRGTLAYGLIQ